MCKICKIIALLFLAIPAQSQVTMPFAFWQSPAGGGYAPLPVTDSLYARYRADSIVVSTVSGDTTYVWQDVSGNDRHAYNLTAAQKPVYWSGEDSAYACFKFDGTDDRLVLVSARPGAQPNSYAVVVRIFKPAVTGVFIDGAVNLSALYTAGGVFTQNAGAVLGSTVFPAIDTTFVIIGRFNGTASSLQINGRKFSGAAGTNQPNGITLGAQRGGSNNANCNLYEVIVYDGLLTDAEVAALEPYLATKWGVTLP